MRQSDPNHWFCEGSRTYTSGKFRDPLLHAALSIADYLHV
jgi:hypothetical protein